MFYYRIIVWLSLGIKLGSPPNSVVFWHNLYTFCIRYKQSRYLSPRPYPRPWTFLRSIYDDTRIAHQDYAIKTMKQFKWLFGWLLSLPPFWTRFFSGCIHLGLGTLHSLFSSLEGNFSISSVKWHNITVLVLLLVRGTREAIILIQ